MRNLFIKDIGWKLFSLLLAAALWFTANRILHESAVPVSDTSQIPITFGRLPVKVVSSEANVRGFGVLPQTVKVNVVGPSSVMSSLAAEDLHVTVKLNGASIKQGAMLPVEISLPPKVAIASIEPDHVLVTPPPQEKQP